MPQTGRHPVDSESRCADLSFTAVQVFFCKYNDPIYVKMEKLEIMIMLASDKNIDQVLLEFKEYATEVDVDFVRKVLPPIASLLQYGQKTRVLSPNFDGCWTTALRFLQSWC